MHTRTQFSTWDNFPCAPAAKTLETDPSCEARRAVQQWYHGQIGGRHCSMVLEHDAAIALFISPLDHDVVAEADVGGFWVGGSPMCARSPGHVTEELGGRNAGIGGSMLVLHWCD